MGEIKLRSEDPFLDDCVLMGRTFLIFGTCLLALGAGLLLGGVSDVGLVVALAFSFAGGSMVAVSLGIAWWVRRREARTMRTRGNVVADLVVYACPKCRYEYRDAADMLACPCEENRENWTTAGALKRTFPRVKTGVREGGLAEFCHDLDGNHAAARRAWANTYDDDGGDGGDDV